MKLQGRNFGVGLVLLPLLVKVATTGGKNRLSLEDLPNEHAGCPVVVKGFLVRYPKAAITLTGSKIMDGVSAYQLAGTTSFAYAEKSPFHRAKGSRMAWSVLDGYTLGTVLSFCSRKPFFMGGGRNHLASDGAVAATDLIEPRKSALALMGAASRKRSLDWPQFLGPFAAADATSTAAVVLKPWFYLPFVQGGEKRERGTPANWFSGKRGGSCSSQNAGYFEVELPAKADDLSIAWTTTGDDGQFQIFAVCELADPKKIPVPLPLCIEELEPGNNAERVKVPAGLVEYLSAMKELDSVGAMQAHSYTELALMLNGDPIVHEVCAENLFALGLALDEADGFSLTHADDAHANAAAAGRRLLNGTPLVLHQGSTLKAPGSDVEGAMEIRINESAETSHRFVCGYRLPMSDTLRAEAEKWASGMVASCGESATVARLEPASENGNAIANAALAAGLPGTIRMVDAKAAMNAAKAPG